MPSAVGARIRRFLAAWTSIYDRLVYIQLPLTDLLHLSEKTAMSTEDAQSIRTLRVPGTNRSYGILMPPETRLSFRVRAGVRPSFEARLKFLDGNLQPCQRGPECKVTVAVAGNGRTVRATNGSRRIRMQLGEYAHQTLTLALETGMSTNTRVAWVVWDTPRLLERRRIKGQIVALIADCRKLGLRGLRQTFWNTLKGELAIEDQKAVYQLWVEAQRLRPDAIREISRSITGFGYLPRFSILTPVYNTDSRWLRKCIESVRGQLYPHWQLCLVDDASTADSVRPVLREYAAIDPRIKVAFSDRNRGISAASNMALQLAEGEFVGLLDHDDELEPDALFHVARLLQRADVDVIYTDEDKLDSDGGRSEPFFKPDWSPEYLLSCMYTSHFTVYRRQLVDDVGGFRLGFEGSQDYDLMLRIEERTEKIYHIPKVLYHWRKATGSAADSTSAKPYAYQAARRALTEHIQRQQMKATLLDGQWRGHYRVRRVVDPNLAVTIFVLAWSGLESLRRCIDSIRSKTTHENHETLVLTDDRRIESYCSGSGTRVRFFTSTMDSIHSSAAINLAVRESESPHLLFLDGGTEVITPEWLEALLEFSEQSEIGAVGAKLLSSDGRINDAGIVTGLGKDEIAGNPLRGFPRDTNYHFGWVGDARNCSAVSGSCMLVRREVFESLEGYDEEFGPSVNALDFCLRVRRKGFRIVWSPFAELYQHMIPFQQIDASDIALMKSRWGDSLLADPYYNPNLTRTREDFGIQL